MGTVMPIGFFENTKEIYAEIASYPVVPPEKIRQYWNVYTTTFRRLVDPSAFRLENFWWHVWGSPRLRSLSGPELARLFEEFSNGPTVVPLPSPADRFKRPKAPGPSHGAEGRGNESTPSPRDGSDQGSASSAGKKGLTPSSSRPPPPHPILKKSRGPSSSGPRPTARFASPPASGEEAVHDGEAVSSSTASAAASEMPPPPLPSSTKQRQSTASASSPPVSNIPEKARGKQPVTPAAAMPPPPLPLPAGEKPAPALGKKVVATTAASKRRPVLVRKPSSQSSTGSDANQRAAAGPGAASRRSASKRSAPTPPQLSGQGSSSSQASDSGLSTKAAGKRRANQGAIKRPAPQAATVEGGGQPGQAGTAQQPRPPSPQRRSTWDVRDSVAYNEAAEGRQGTAQQRPAAPPPRAAPPPVAGFVADQAFGYAAPPMVRSRSSNSDRPHRPREPAVALLRSQPTSSVAMVTATARGQFDSETVTPEPAVPEVRDTADGVSLGSRPSSSTLDQQQLKPTPPNPAPPIPFGRSKSELTLLLARGGKPRKGEDK
ncbi:hypothetical protein VTH06DRAFT_8557 [Thermothelomyces fergusii]